MSLILMFSLIQPPRKCLSFFNILDITTVRVVKKSIINKRQYKKVCAASGVTPATLNTVPGKNCRLPCIKNKTNDW